MKLTDGLKVAAASLLTLTAIPSLGHARAQAVAATPGVTATSITFGTSLPESGPAGVYNVIAGGEQAYFSYVNAHGGVFGRKISLKVLDDGYDPARTVSNVQRLVLADNVFGLIGVLGTANNLASLPFITKQGVPLVYPATGSSLMAQPFHKDLFPLQVTYTTEGKVLTDYAVKTLHAKNIGVFYQNDDFGKEGLAAVTSQAKKDGATMADAEPYQVTDLSFKAQALRLQNVDAVIIFAIPTPAATFIGTAATAGLKAKLLSSSIAEDPVVLKGLKSAGEGVYFDDYAPLPTADDPQATMYRSVLKQYGDPVTAPIGAFTEAGYGAAQVAVEGLRRAGKNLTRAGFISALETLRNWRGSVLPRVTFTSSSHAASPGAYVLVDHNAALTPVSGYDYP